MTLQEWMTETKRTQEEVARLLKVSQPTVSRILAGRVTDDHRDKVRDMTSGAVELAVAS